MSDRLELTTFGFEVAYSVERLLDAPRISVHEYAPIRRPAFQGGLVLETPTSSLLLRVKAESGGPWVGRFSGGPGGVTGCFATPDRNTLCVVSEGQGYWVSALQPPSFEAVRAIPIKQVVPIREACLLLFATSSRLVAYGSSGFRWLTADLSWDGIEVSAATEKEIHGFGWDAPHDRNVEFTVDPLTGMSEGGSSPAAYGAQGEQSPPQG